MLFRVIITVIEWHKKWDIFIERKILCKFQERYIIKQQNYFRIFTANMLDGLAKYFIQNGCNNSKLVRF